MFSISLFYYISFFVLSPIRFCYMFYNFEVIILFLNASHLCNDLLPPPSGVPAPASHAHPTSAFFSFPYFWGASLDFGAATHLGATCFPPLSGVPLPVSHRHLTPQTSLPPRLPGCQTLPHMHISPLAFFSFPHFRGATPCLTSASHHANISSPCLPGCSPMPYGSWASFPAELFLRSRECTGFPEKKVMWSAELSEEKG